MLWLLWLCLRFLSDRCVCTQTPGTNWQGLVTRHPGVQLPASAPPPASRQHTAKTVSSRAAKNPPKSPKMTHMRHFHHLRASAQTCRHCECLSYGVLCLITRVEGHMSATFTFPSVLPSSASSMASSVSSLAYPGSTSVNIFPKRVTIEASPWRPQSRQSRTQNMTIKSVRGMVSAVG